MLLTGGRVSAPYAALANAVMAHAVEFDDTYEPADVHGYAVVLPAVMAMADRELGLGSTTGFLIMTSVKCRHHRARRRDHAEKLFDDLMFHGQAYAHVVRSPHAHARILGFDRAGALAVPGVLGVFTSADLAADNLGVLKYPISIANADGSAVFGPPRSSLATDRVRHVGEAVALVVAETVAQARDAGEQVVVEYEPLPVVLDPTQAMLDDAVLLWDEAPRNTSFVWETGDRARVDAAFAAAAHVCRQSLVHNRLVAAPLEPRGAIGVYDHFDNRYLLYASIQEPQATHSVISQHGLKIEGSRLRVIVPDVGGGFGMKNFAYPELMLMPWAAQKLNCPVKWSSERGESFVSDDQGRGHYSEAELALDQDGRFLAVRVRFLSNLGAYLTTSGSRVSTVVGSRGLTSVYAIGAAHVETRGVFTNMVPSGSYRGAGKPEFIYVIERLVDAAARELGVDPIELRRRNLVPPSAMPYRNAMGDVIDVGDFGRNLDEALRRADHAGFPQRRREAANRGRHRGLGLSLYAQPDGLKDGRARIVLDTTGAVTVAVSAQSNGQGHATTFAQIAADQLGVPMAQIRVLQGDTDRTGFGAGTGGSRSVTVCGSAIVAAAEKIVAQGKRLVAAMNGVDPSDIAFADGIFRVLRTNKTMDIASVARAAYVVANVPPGEELGLEASSHYGGHRPNFSSGCHVCEVEIDPETGSLDIKSYVAVDDFGRLINPMLVEGQVHGGIVQGIGQALLEECIYDSDTGQPLTGSFSDYSLPRADDVPPFLCVTTRTLCTTNPLGVKGCGEAGTTAAPPAVINAILDALKELGVRHIDMPATPYKIWQACQMAKRTDLL
jgi:carbon-monoxide dehydrogenase large subunit